MKIQLRARVPEECLAEVEIVTTLLAQNTRYEVLTLGIVPCSETEVIAC